MKIDSRSHAFAQLRENYFLFLLLFAKNSLVSISRTRTDVLSSIDIFGLEDNLPDELVSSGNNWGEQMGGNKPPAQGPGPGNQHINGEDPNAMQRQLQQQQLHQLMQQQQQVTNRQQLFSIQFTGFGLCNLWEYFSV